MRRRQRGYLIEVPVVLMLLLAGVALLMPRLSPVGRRVLIVVAAAPILALLYGLILVPGWQPGDVGARRRYARIAGFLLSAAAVVAAVVLAIRG